MSPRAQPAVLLVSELLGLAWPSMRPWCSADPTSAFLCFAALSVRIVVLNTFERSWDTIPAIMRLVILTRVIVPHTSQALLRDSK